jgi:hypothetical protein
MADSHPFAYSGLSQYGGDKNYASGGDSGGGGLGLVAAAYLAHKLGLVDLNDPDQQKAIQKNGLLGNVIKGAIAPSGGIQMPVSPSGAISSPVQMPSIQGVPLGPLSSNTQTSPITTGSVQGSVLPPLPSVAQANPTSGNAGMDQQLSSSPVPPQYTSGSSGMDSQLASSPENFMDSKMGFFDPDMLDEGIGNFAALLMG